MNLLGGCDIRASYFKVKSYPCSRPWRPIGLWDVEAPTFSRQSAHRWQWGCQTRAGHPLPPGRFLVLISVRGWVNPRTHSVSARIRALEKSNDVGNRTATFGLVAESLLLVITLQTNFIFASTHGGEIRKAALYLYFIAVNYELEYKVSVHNVILLI
jgi:hypothetical protein